MVRQENIQRNTDTAHVLVEHGVSLETRSTVTHGFGIGNMEVRIYMYLSIYIYRERDR